MTSAGCLMETFQKASVEGGLSDTTPTHTQRGYVRPEGAFILLTRTTLIVVL